MPPPPASGEPSPATAPPASHAVPPLASAPARSASGASAGAAGRAAPPAGALDAVLKRMRTLAAALPPPDGVAVFDRVYLTVTEEVDRLLHTPAGPDGFADPATARALTVDFAGRYLAALDADTAGRPVPRCWRPLLELRDSPRVHPLQFALAGMNAHIAHDLPLSVVTVCAARDIEPEELAGDYHRVNAVLADVEGEARADLAPGRPDPLKRVEPLVHLVDSWSVARARDAAWAAARALWALRGHPGLADDFALALDRTVGLVSRHLLTPLG